MNNKGQSLVTFILLLPLIFLLIAIVYDLGSAQIMKQKIQNDVKSTITYGLKNIENPDIKPKMQIMLDKNIEGKKTINIENNTIEIKVNFKQNSIFPNIINEDYNINVAYKGSITNKKIRINKE